MADSTEGNVYVRLSLMRPKTGQEDQVSEILNKLVEYYSSRPGYLSGYTLVGTESSSEVGRFTLWNSERDAENVANTQHVLALRAELLRLVEAGTHVEKSFAAEPHVTSKSG